ncbi:MAG: iron complex outermembrane recepter protein, partial [Limisphaerales bacterium]
ISARGFNDTFANKLLVLVDGRSVYTPLFSGVYWDVQDTLLEDLERIEVIRGPGSALWGANAVNGVINIITKSAKDTVGTLVTVGGGTEDQGMVGVRHGLKLADALFLRVYGKGFVRDHSMRFGGGDANDEWRQARGGFRLDWEPSDVSQLTFQGDLYGGGFHHTVSLPALVAPFATTEEQVGRVTGGNVLLRWKRQLAEGSDLQFQTYYDRTARDASFYAETREAVDFEFQHHFQLGERHDVTWGINHRLTRDDAYKQSFTVTLTPGSEGHHLSSFFLQDQIELVPDQLKLTLGAKVERNDYTGWSLQPSARLLWSPHPEHHLWAAVSRAVRTPSRAERTARVNLGAAAGPTVFAYLGSPEAGDERLVAYELGHRWQARPELSFDTALFYNRYSNLGTAETGAAFLEATPAPAHFTVPLVQANLGHGETYGAEISGRWQATERWRVTASYAQLVVQIHNRPGSTDAGLTTEGSSPRNQATLRSAWDLPRGFAFDTTLRYVDNLRSLQVPAYLTLDARLAWRPQPNLEFALVGQNLLDRAHPEFRPQTIATERTEVERAVYVKVTYKF